MTQDRPTLTIQLGNFKLEVNRQIRQEADGNLLLQRIIKRSIGNDYINKTESYHLNDYIFDRANHPTNDNRGEWPFEVEFRGEEEETNMSGGDSIERFKKSWNDYSPIAKHFPFGLNE